MDIYFDFTGSSGKMQIEFETELITIEDYYGTIGAYRLAWENICIKNKFNSGGLRDLAESLDIDHSEYSNNEDLCEKIGETVGNLKWKDFESNL